MHLGLPERATFVVPRLPGWWAIEWGCVTGG